MNRAKEWLILAAVSLVSTLVLWIPAGMKTIYENFDGPYYLVVAKTWYSKALIEQSFSFPLPTEYYAAHFPLYPALIRVINFLPGLTGPRAMVGINILASVLTAIIIYEIAVRLKWPQPLFLGLVWLFWWPRIWVVRSVGSPETLFIGLIFLSLYFYKAGKYFWSGVAGALATLTKSPGILLFAAYGVLFLKSRNFKTWPVILIPLALLALFTFYKVQTGDFLAYFHSGDNIHLQALPFRIFDSSQPWVGDFWLEDILWIYLVGGLGVYYAFKKDTVFGTFGAIYYLLLLFVSHRDLSRYSLPLIPIVLLGFSELFNRKEIRWAMALMIIPLYFYSLNFLLHNTVSIANWAPFL